MPSSRLNIRIEPLANPRPVHLPEVLGFGRYFTNRMFTQRYSPEQGWHDAAIAAYQPLALDPASGVLHSGQDVFEGIKAYRRADDRINFFRLDQHMARFNRSATRMGMPQIDADLHMDAIRNLVGLEHEWIPSQPGSALYIRPVMVSSETTLEVRASQTFLHFIGNFD